LLQSSDSQIDADEFELSGDTPLLIHAFDGSRRKDARVRYVPLPHVADNESISVARHDLENAIVLAGGYLTSVCDPQGRFDYRRHIDGVSSTGEPYNVLRHAGAMYALAEFQRWRNDDVTAETLGRAAQFLRERCILPYADESGPLAVWSPPELTGERPLQAKLGGTGLGLIALVAIEQLQPGQIPRDELQRLGRFIISMQKPDGSFYSKFYRSPAGRDASWTSLYYPGEAALGLLFLYELDPDPKWLEVAGRAMGYLGRSRREDPSTSIPADHWTLLAISHLLRHDLPSHVVTRDELLQHADQICRAILHEQFHDDTNLLLAGSFGNDGRTTPTATRLEGLLGALTFVPDDSTRLRREIETSVERGMVFLLRAQVRAGSLAGAMPRSIGKRFPAVMIGDRQFNQLAGEVRIDYVQHALSAWLQYWKYTH
jgi:hypothetical protein